MTIKDQKKIESELYKRKMDITKALYALVATLSSFALMIYIYQIITNFERFSKSLTVMSFAVTTTVFVISTVVRLKINIKNIKWFKLLLTIVFILVLIYVTVALGTDHNIVIYPLLVIESLSLLGMYDSKIATIFFTIFSIFILSVALLQINGIIDFPVRSFDPMNMFDQLIQVAFSWFILRIGLIINANARKSYIELVRYSNNAQDLVNRFNTELQEHKDMLNDKYNKIMRTNEPFIILGYTARQTFHDLAGSLSIQKGQVNILRKKDPENTDLEKLDKKIDFTQTMVKDVSDIVNYRKVSKSFNVSNSIEKVITLLKERLEHNRINIEFKKFSSSNLEGIPSLFERVILNLLMNSIEVLKDKPGKRNIEISLRSTDSIISIEFKDDGSGISEENLQNIFRDGFSTKPTTHLGSGLNFIKETIEKKFNGTITVKSLEGSYTKFVLNFNELIIPD